MMCPEPRNPINIPYFSETAMLGPDGEEGEHRENEYIGGDDRGMVFWFEDLGVRVEMLMRACVLGAEEG